MFYTAWLDLSYNLNGEQKGNVSFQIINFFSRSKQPLNYETFKNSNSSNKVSSRTIN